MMFKKTILATTIVLCANANAVSSEIEPLDNVSSATSIPKAIQATEDWESVEHSFPKAPIQSSATPKPLPRQHIDRSIIYGATFENSQLSSLLIGEDPSVNSMMIIQDGKVIFEHHNVPEYTRHVSLSNPQAIASLMVAKLESEGKIDVRKPLKDYVPTLKDNAWGNVPVMDVLTIKPDSDLHEAYVLRENSGSPLPELEFAESLDTANNDSPALDNQTLGDISVYGSENTHMLGLLISTVENESVDEVFKEQILAEAGMPSSGYYSLTPNGYEVVHGLLSLDIEDMARLAMLFTPSAKSLSNEDIIPYSAVKKIQQSVKPGHYKVSPESFGYTEMFPDEKIGGTYKFDAVFEDGDLYKGSLNGKGLYISPEKNIVAVWFSNRVEKHDVASYVRNLVKNHEKRTDLVYF